MKERSGMLPAAPPARSPFRRHLKLLFLVLALLVVASFMGNRGLMRLYHLQRERAELTREIDRLGGTNALLAEQVRGLKTDPGRIEAIAREELGLVKPGEQVYEFRSPPRPETLPQAR